MVHFVAAEAYAPGKIILHGEHSVVYGTPAIAVPVQGVKAHVTVSKKPKGSSVSIASKKGISIFAPQVGRYINVFNLRPVKNPLLKPVIDTLKHLGVKEVPNMRIEINSDIPIASGLGSGAAVAVATIRAVGRAFGKELSDEVVSNLAFETEKIHHGTPSGIDNNVISHEKPVFFIKGQKPKTLEIGAPITLVVANTGIEGNTKELVAGVRERKDAGEKVHWKNKELSYDDVFEIIGSITNEAKGMIESGRLDGWEELINNNHELLRGIGVSHPRLELLTKLAIVGGADGAKLVGAGGGGNMIAYVKSYKSLEDVEFRAEKIAGRLRSFLKNLGVKEPQVFVTTLQPTNKEEE